MKKLIEVRDMTIGHKGRILFSNVSFDICEGDCIMLCGANGSGKTTMMKSLCSIKDIVMIPSRIPKVKGFSLREFIRISCYSKSDLGGRLAPEQETALDIAIERMGLSGLEERDISTLSDGEFQKAGIASALVRDASIILLDEPTAFLDAENRISVLHTLKALSQTPDTSGQFPAIIFSTHDLHDGLAVANKVIALGADGVFRISSDNMSETVATIFRNK